MKNSQLVKKGVWMHDRIDDNADAHIKASLIGNSISVPVKSRKLQLGSWQNIFLSRKRNLSRWDQLP